MFGLSAAEQWTEDNRPCVQRGPEARDVSPFSWHHNQDAFRAHFSLQGLRFSLRPYTKISKWSLGNCGLHFSYTWTLHLSKEGDAVIWIRCYWMDPGQYEEAETHQHLLAICCLRAHSVVDAGAHWFLRRKNLLLDRPASFWLRIPFHCTFPDLADSGDS